METIKAERFNQIFSHWGKHKVLILGDVMLDEYLWGNVSRISPEAPVPVVEILKESIKLGGAANVALNVKALGDEPILVGVIGKDKNGERMREALNAVQIPDQGIFAEDTRHTTIKTRVIAHSQQVVRADREDTQETSSELTDRIVDFVKKKIGDIGALIISDYGKGVITMKLLSELIDLCQKNRIFVGVDPKETLFLNYKKVSLITPNHHEAAFAFGKKIKDEEILKEVGWGLMERLEVNAMLITKGELGMSLFERNGSLTHFPTRAKKVYDVTGAGDTVISTFTSAFSAGASYKEAALISNHAAGMVIGEIGTAQVTKDQLIEELKDFVKD
ncbi:MAG: D-glycero-beta-D-manno-heptose-7-phosphate kinase [Candidatus Zixiibacteriota bacterium]